MESKTSVEQKNPDALSESGGQDMASQKLRIGIVKELAARLLQELIPLTDAPEPRLRPSFDFYDEVRHFEINLIVSALNRTGGNQLRAARLLGLKATTLHSKLKLYNITTKMCGVAAPGDGEAYSNLVRLSPDNHSGARHKRAKSR